MAASIFITATEARQNPYRERTIHDEARGIESAILEAARLGFYETTVSDGTPMTMSTPSLSDAWTVNAGTDQLYVPNHGYATGEIITVSSTQALPSPLQSNRYYYVIYVDSDHIKLAASFEDAVSSRPIGLDITNAVTSVQLVQQGDGYIQPPVVSFNGGGAQVAATASASLASWGSVLSISNRTPGSGYNDQPEVQIVPQGSGADYLVVAYLVVGMTVQNPGLDYHLGDIISVVGGTGAAATAVITEVSSLGEIQALQLSNPGNYTVLPTLAGASTNVQPGGGSGATVNLTMGISTITLDNGGNGYVAPPRVRVIDPSGVGAIVRANLTGGAVTSITVVSPGYGYVGVTDVTFDSGAGATAVASLLPTSVAEAVVTNAGSGYTSPPSVTILTAGSGAMSGTVSMAIVGLQMTSGGTGYRKDDLLLISGGVATETAYLRVTAVSTSGAILTHVLESGGSYTMLPGLISNPVIGGSGILAAFNCLAGVKSITVANGGSGYVVPPVVSVSTPSGTSPRTAVIHAVVSSGLVQEFRVVDSGQGYTSIPTLALSNGTGATASANLIPTSLDEINIQDGGSGYTYATVVISGGGATVDATATAEITGGTITNIDLVDPGNGYTSTPTVTIQGDGNDAQATAVLSSTGVLSLTIINPGTGYNTPPNINIAGNATASARLQSTGIDRLIVNDTGENYTSDPVVYLLPGPNQGGVPVPPVMSAQRGFSIASISVTNNGVGYLSVPTVVIGPPQVSTGTQATANANIGAGSGTFAISRYHHSRDYFKVWKGQVPSNPQLIRPYEDQMNTIVTYFTNMGYTINRLSNPSTSSTMMWKVQW